MTIVSKLEQEGLLDMDVHRCLTLPPSLEIFALNASSPNLSSSTTSSSMAGHGNETGHSSIHSEIDCGDSTSTVSTAAGSSDPERSLEGSHISSSSNIPSPIIEECPIMPSNEGVVDCISEDRDLDLKPSLDDACLSATCCGQHSSSDGMFMSRLDELLQSDTPQEFAAESGLACVDDLFPSLNNTGQDFSLLDGMSTWSTESLQSLEALPFPEEEFLQSGSVSLGGEESAAQMFTQWLRNNAHWISLSDLRKIKLKTSTIENATKRLGGGKNGMMLFLKFVLMWVQNSQMKRAALMEAAPGNGFLSSGVQSRASLSGISAMPMEGAAMTDRLRPIDSPCTIQASGVQAHTLSGCGSPLPHRAVNSSCANWSSRAQWTQTPVVEHNVTVPSPNQFSTLTNGRGGSPLHSTTLGRFSSAWPVQSNILYGAASSSIPPSLRSPASGSNSSVGGGGIGDSASVMLLMQQQQCPEASPAATTRAARKSRMERQRWSVRRNRKWSAAAQQSQQRLIAAVSNGSVHANVPAWSQVLGGTPPNLAFPNSRACQHRPSSRSAVMECQQNKKPQRNLSLLFQKELKQSDVGNLGRIVLPKAAETCLPPLDLRDGVNLVVEDMNSAKIWNMRYRFWPNNKSRMYLLENTGDFVKSYDLKEGDYMMLFALDNLENRFVIKGAKGPGQAAMLSSDVSMEDISNAGGTWNGAKGRKSFSKETADLVLMGSANSQESCDDSLLAEHIEQSLEDLKESET